MVWTRFMDMHSGGNLKEKQQYIYIEAPQNVAEVVFYNRFGHNANRVSCTCCGPDYSISEEESLEEASAYERGCRYGYFKPNGEECPQNEAWVPGRGLRKDYKSNYIEDKNTRKHAYLPYVPLNKYITNKKKMVVIYDSEIKPNEKKGDLPEQGYVWKD